MLHGKVLRSPLRRTRGSASIDISRGARDRGRRRDPDRRRPRRHRALLRPRDQGSPDRRDRPRALRGRAGRRRRGRRRGDGGGGGARDRGRLRAAAGARHDRAGARARGAARCTSAVPKIGLFHGLGELGEQQGNVCYRHLIEAGDVEAARARAAIVVEGTYTFPAVYQYAMETHATIAHYHGDGVTLWANCQHPFLVQAEIADLFGLPIGSVRIVVPYLGGGFGSKSYTKMEPLTVALARKAGRPVRIVNRVEESMVTSRRHGMRAWMRTSAAADGTLLDARGALLDGHRRLRRQRPARRRHRRRRGARPLPLRGGRASQGNCVYCNTPAVGVLPRVRRHPPAVDRRVPARRGRPPRRASTRSSCAGAAWSCRASRSAPTARGKPLDADLVGDVEAAAAAVGWDEPRRAVGRPRRQRRPARRGRAPGLARVGAAVLGRLGRRLRRDDGDGAGPAHGDGADRRRGALPLERAGARPRRRHALHALRPLDRREPLDHGRRASRSSAPPRTSPRACARPRASCGTSTPTRSSSRDGRAALAGEEITYPDLIAKRFGFRGGEIIEGGEVRPSGGDTGSYAEGPHFWEVCVAGAEVEVDPDTGVDHRAAHRDRRRRRAGRSTRSSSSARTRARRCRASATRCSRRCASSDGEVLNDSLLEYRVPRIGDLPGAMTLDHRRERRRPRALRRQGLRRGSARGGARGDRLRARRRGRAHERASADPRARVAPDPGAARDQRRPRRRKGDMSELNRATILGSGTMGPGMGAVLARAGLQVTLHDVKRGRARRGRRAWSAWSRACSSASRSRSRRRRRCASSPTRRRARGRRARARGDPRALELKQQVLARDRGPDLRRGDHRVQHLGHPDHEDRGEARPPRARDRLALVQPAAPDPDERGDQRRAHRAGGDRGDRGADAAHRLPPGDAEEGGPRLRREPRALRDHARVPRARRRGRDRRRGARPRASSGGSATSSRSCRRSSCWTWPGSTSTRRWRASSTPTSPTSRASRRPPPTCATRVASGSRPARGFFEYTPERVAELQQQRGAALVAVRKALS